MKRKELFWERICGKKEKIDFGKLNLDQIRTLCSEHGLIDEKLSKRVDKVRVLPNRQHLGSLAEVDLDYTGADLEHAFSVIKEISGLAARKISRNRTRWHFK